MEERNSYTYRNRLVQTSGEIKVRDTGGFIIKKKFLSIACFFLCNIAARVRRGQLLFCDQAIAFGETGVWGGGHCYIASRCTVRGEKPAGG